MDSDDLRLAYGMEALINPHACQQDRIPCDL
jgi:hypothetical protein